MSNPTKRLLPFLLGLCLLFPVGCGQKTPPEAGTGTDSGQASGEETYPLDFDGRRYEDYSFDILRYDTESDRGWTGIPNDIYVASAGADTLEQAVYSRNEQLRALLGANVTMKLWGNGLSTHLRQKLNDGSKPYDAVVQVTTYLYQLFNMGLIRDMDTLGLDTSFDWWDPNATDTFTIEGKMFGAVSDMTYIDKLSTIGVFFRPDVVRDLEMDDPFALVENGDWSYDAFYSSAKKATDNIDGMNGISCQNDAPYFFLHAANLKTAEKDSSGSIVSNINGERQITLLQNIYALMNSEIFFNRQTAGLDPNETARRFAEAGKNLYLVRPLQAYYNIKDYTSNYGILPMPKYDELVTGYYSPVNIYSAGVLCIPKNAENPERLCDLLQAMAMLSNRIVMPEFYNTVLGRRFAGDPQSAKMLDLIFRNRVYDIGMIWNFGKVRDILVKSGDDIKTAAGTVSSDIKSAYETILDDIDAFVTDMKDYK